MGDDGKYGLMSISQTSLFSLCLRLVAAALVRAGYHVHLLFSKNTSRERRFLGLEPHVAEK